MRAPIGVPGGSCSGSGGFPDPLCFLKGMAIEVGGSLPYTQEAYCNTNGRCIAGFSVFKAQKPTRHSDTNWRRN